MPARGGSRGSRRARPGRRRAPRASPRSARAARPASAFGQRVVGGVADQQVAEAEGVLAGKLGPVGPDQLLAHERGQARRRPEPRAGLERLRPRRGGRPGPRPSRARAPSRSCGSSWSRRAASSAWIVGGTRHLAVRLVDQRDHLLDEERVALGGLDDARAQAASRGAPSSCSISCSVSADASGSSRTVVAFSLPPRPAGRRSSSSGRAMQSSRIGASRERSATCSTRSRNVGSAQWRSSKTHDERPLRGDRLEQLAERPGDLLARGAQLPLAEQGADRRRARDRVAASLGQLLDDLDDRPVRDALAVGEAAAAHDGASSSAARNSADEARLADAGGAEDREELARALATARAPDASRSWRSSRSRPTIGASSCRAERLAAVRRASSR